MRSERSPASRSSRRGSFALLVLVCALLFPGRAATQPSDPAARGVDLFVHASPHVFDGSTLSVLVEAIGFAAIDRAAPLADAVVEGAWDPETLGEDVGALPAPVTGTTDASGRLRLEVPAPPGTSGSATLLLRVRHGVHERVRELSVSRGERRRLELFIGDRRVVPGSTLSGWVLATDAVTSRPLAHADVVVSLAEAGAERFSAKLKTDRSGVAMMRVPIPRTREVSWSWDLSATIAGSQGQRASASATLSPREETPGTPTLRGWFHDASVRPGDRTTFHLSLRDASGEPVAGASAQVWLGPRGTTPPDKDEDWEAQAVPAPKTGDLPMGKVLILRTDASGLSARTVSSPSVVSPAGTEISARVKVAYEGRTLESSPMVRVGSPRPSIELAPEAGVLVPGLEQRILLSVRTEREEPVRGAFVVEADGLRTEVSTDAHGEAELTWRPPADVGANRNVGPCPGGVAAAITVRPLPGKGEAAEQLGRTEPFELCIEVDRDKKALVKLDHTVVRAGGELVVRVESTTDGPWTVVLEPERSGQPQTAWLSSGRAGVRLPLPADAHGIWKVTAVSPGRHAASLVASGAVLVLPATLPTLTAKVVGGRATPGGAVEVEAQLTDESGRGLPGSVAAVMIDAYGGGSLSGLEHLDTRLRLCDDLGVVRERCDAALDARADADALRRGRLGDHTASPLPPALDPGAAIDEQLATAFRSVVMSVEGAVYESTSDPERLRDVRRKGPRGWEFNPELMTLAVAALGETPETPGGEALSLADMIAVDRQVTFDNVARRVTRLKLFQVLSQIRTFKLDHRLDEHEPTFADPNALVRRLVRDGLLEDASLLDPWGGTLTFVKTGAAPQAFLTVSRGWELRSPGPDGRLQTGDDVKDPFERVLSSGTPYAIAVDEDRLVDLRWELEVGEETVAHWDSVLKDLTGMSLGLSGIGSGGGGTGQGYGSGHGRLGGGHRARPPSLAITTGDAYWAPPRRTDDAGRVKLSIPLGGIETTWAVALVGIPDDAGPATTRLEIASSQPLSARVEAGARWIEGDRVETLVTVRNRTERAASATLELQALGVARLESPARASVSVPPGGEASVRVPMSAPTSGAAGLRVRLGAPGFDPDEVDHRWEVARAGEVVRQAHVEWVTHERDLSPWLERPGLVPLGPGTLVLERGIERGLAAALTALDPDYLPSADAMADALEAAGWIHRYATSRGEPGAELAARALDVGRRALGRLDTYGEERRPWPLEARALRWGPGALLEESRRIDECPPVQKGKEAPLEILVDGLDAEPPPQDGAIASCWSELVSDVVQRVRDRDDPDLLARAVLSLAERPHRRAEAKALAERLRRRVRLAPNGVIELPRASSRSDRSLVYAALLAATRWQDRPRPSASTLVAWLGVQRDPVGGYGSPLATRVAVRALLSTQDASQKPTANVIAVRLERDGSEETLSLAREARRVTEVAEGSASIRISPDQGGVTARLERTYLRPWTTPPAEGDSPLRIEVEWPEAKAGHTGELKVALRSLVAGEHAVDVRIPLPPGVELAAPVKSAHQVQGTIIARVDVDDVGVPLLLPLRFGLSGKVTAPEATARLLGGHATRALAPARTLVIR